MTDASPDAIAKQIGHIRTELDALDALLVPKPALHAGQWVHGTMRCFGHTISGLAQAWSGVNPDGTVCLRLGGMQGLTASANCEDIAPFSVVIEDGEVKE